MRFSVGQGMMYKKEKLENIVQINIFVVFVQALISYILGQQSRLERYTENGNLEININWIET